MSSKLLPPIVSKKNWHITKATTFSQTTLHAGTAQVSERSTVASYFSNVFTFIELRGLYNVGIGFIAHLTTSSSPVVIPPSIPPNLFVTLFIPSSWLYTISSITLEPGSFATSNPIPNSTPLIACIPIRCIAITPSIFLSNWVYEPSPGIRFLTLTSTTPPIVSLSFFISSICEIILASISLFAHLTSEESTLFFI